MNHEITPWINWNSEVISEVPRPHELAGSNTLFFLKIRRKIFLFGFKRSLMNCDFRGQVPNGDSNNSERGRHTS